MRKAGREESEKDASWVPAFIMFYLRQSASSADRKDLERLICHLPSPILAENGNLRIQFLCRFFNRIGRVLPDTASRRFHATRPKPQSRKPAWLPFYTGGGSSLRSVPSAFIFRLPCGQQRSITPPYESNQPPSPLRGGGRPDCAEALRD